MRVGLGSSSKFFGLMSVPFWQHLIIIGSILFGAVFMATDPVTAAQTNKGKWIYGFLIGFISIMIRVFNPSISRRRLFSDSSYECICTNY